MGSWLVPAVLVPVVFSLALALNGFGAQGSVCAMGLVGVMMILAVQGWAGFRAYYRQVEVDQLRARRDALTLSAEGQLAEAFAHMHPETARLVLNYQKTVWLIDECDVDDVCTWYLKADPRINARFVEWVLLNSNMYAIMPAHGRLNDKAFNWDRTVSDRLMYQAFCDVLIRRHMLTDPNGNQPGLWIEPWNPARVAKRFGLVLEEEASVNDK